MEIFEKLDLRIEDLDLSVRTYNCLKRAGIHTVYDILRHMPVSIMSVRNLGRKSCEEISEKLKSLGFSIHFQLSASGICELAKSWLKNYRIENVLLRLLEERLAELECDTGPIQDSFVAYNEKNYDLPLEQKVIKFVLGYYQHETERKSLLDMICNHDFFDIELEEDDEDEDEDEDHHSETQGSGPATEGGEIQGITAKPAALAALERMTGLRRVKEMVSDISAHCIISIMKKQAGGKEQVFIPNALFLGNPGTGKTTVARIIAELYKEIGLLKKGHLVVKDQSDLIGEYVGQTAPKVKEAFTSALGGVLFVDEAYTLNAGYSYGQEAAAMLANMMTEYKGQCCVILAGYEDSMNRMMRETNPGLRERFPFRLVFDDYSADELMEIFMSSLEDSKLRISKEGRQVVNMMIGELLSNRDEEFANARIVENILQEIVLHQERRLYNSHIGNARITEEGFSP